MSVGVVNGRHDRRAPLTSIVGVSTLIFLLSPMVVVAAASFDDSEFFTFPPADLSGRWFAELIDDDRWRASLFLSLQIAALSAAASTIIGGLAGLALARVARSVRFVLLPVVLAPLVIPAIVLAISFYRIVLEVDLVGRVATFAAANTLLSAPLVTILVAGAATRLDQRLEFASLSCGASRARTILSVTVPLILPTAIAGGVFAFIFAMGEVVMSIFLVAPDRTPVAVRMFLEARQGPAPLVTAASTALIAVSLVLVLAGSLIGGRGSPPPIQSSGAVDFPLIEGEAA